MIDIKSASFKIALAALIVVVLASGKYLVEHRVGYGAVDSVNSMIPDGFAFTEKSEIPERFQVSGEYQDIRQVGGMFSEQFSCAKLGTSAEVVPYWEQTAGYGITGGWSYRFAAVCGDDYVVVYGADHLGEIVYGPFSLREPGER